MKLKSRYWKVINDVANTSMELCMLTDWSREGFSQKDYVDWVNSVSRLLEVIIKYHPDDLIKKRFMKKCYVMFECFDAGFRTEENLIFVCSSKEYADKLKSQHLNWYYKEVEFYD